MKEKCGIFGIYSTNNTNVTPLIISGLQALQHRGQESWGIATRLKRVASLSKVVATSWRGNDVVQANLCLPSRANVVREALSESSCLLTEFSNSRIADFAPSPLPFIPTPRNMSF